MCNMLSKTDNHNYVYATNTKDIEAAGGCLSITVEKHPIEIRNQNEVWIDISSAAVADTYSYQYHYQMLLENGLKRNIPLMIAKTVIAMLGNDARNREVTNEKEMLNAFHIGLDFGSKYKQSGWGQGLTIHTCMMNIIPYLDAEDRPYALYHGLAA